MNTLRSSHNGARRHLTATSSIQNVSANVRPRVCRPDAARAIGLALLQLKNRRPTPALLERALYPVFRHAVNGNAAARAVLDNLLRRSAAEIGSSTLASRPVRNGKTGADGRKRHWGPSK